jgi:hypothetical protein
MVGAIPDRNGLLVCRTAGRLLLHNGLPQTACRLSESGSETPGAHPLSTRSVVTKNTQQR